MRNTYECQAGGVKANILPKEIKQNLPLLLLTHFAIMIGMMRNTYERQTNERVKAKERKQIYRYCCSACQLLLL